MADQEFWKGKFVDRDWLKSLIHDGFKRCAKQNVDAVVGSMVNDIEEYIAGEVILNTVEAMKSISVEFQKAIDFQQTLADSIAEHQVKRRSAQLERGGTQP